MGFSKADSPLMWSYCGDVDIERRRDLPCTLRTNIWQQFIWLAMVWPTGETFELNYNQNWTVPQTYKFQPHGICKQIIFNVFSQLTLFNCKSSNIVKIITIYKITLLLSMLKTVVLLNIFVETDKKNSWIFGWKENIYQKYKCWCILGKYEFI